MKNGLGILALVLIIAGFSFIAGAESEKLKGRTILEDSNGPIAYGMKWEDCLSVAFANTSRSYGCRKGN